MAKKSNNPAEAQRKAARARELKKNKEARQKVRETQTVKRDTREIESEIKHLETQTDAAGKTRLAELQKEVDYVNRIKAQFVADNPEAHDKVYRVRSKPEGDAGGDAGGEGEASGSGSGAGKGPRHLYDERGRLRDPKRSVYYDPVYNPFGAPPPGMPYRERTPVEESEEEDEDESDDEIVMPDGPPPAADSDSDADSDSSDDIPLPEGPPPPRALPAPLPPTGPPRPPHGPGFFHSPPVPQGFRPRPPFGGPVRPGMVPGPGFSPQGMGGSGMAAPMGGVPGSFRPPRPFLGGHPHARPPAGVQDPLSDQPTQTYQGHRIAAAPLPARPPAAPTAIPTPATAAAGESAGAPGSGEITAAPVMRDLRKESTAFVPRGVKRRKPAAGGSAAGLVGGRVNAAPGAGEIDEDGDERKRKGDVGGGLMGKLGGILGAGAGSAVGPGAGGAGSGGGRKEGVGADDDYQKFLDGLGDLA